MRSKFSKFVFIFLYLLSDQVLAQDDCKCVPFYQCKEGRIVTNGEIMINPRRGPITTISVVPKNCSDYTDVCCKPPKVTNTTFKNYVETKCGVRNPDGVGFKISGDPSLNRAQFAEFPWMIAVLFKNITQTTYKFKCGGSLINEKVVLTAAHSVTDSGDYHIRAGEWDTQNTKEIYKHQEIEVSRVVIYPVYMAEGLRHDIALLFLEKSVERASHQNFICLPSYRSIVPPGTDCIVTGWGQDTFEKVGVYEAILKRVEVSIMPRPKCRQALQGLTQVGPTFNLHYSFICAGGEPGVGVCTGDGGGPLVCPIKGRVGEYQQVGIASWGIGCGQSGVPGVYVDVAQYRDWIDEEIRKRNLDSTTYEFKA